MFHGVCGLAERTTAELVDGVYTVTLNRPEKRNAIDSPMVDSLLERLEYAELKSEVRVVALRGAGRDFCAGADLKELLDSVDQNVEENAEGAMHLGSVFLRMRALPKPVVALVKGNALAGGCGLATACDMVLAQSDATFGYPEVRRGFVPAMVMAMLLRAVGEKTAFDLVATGRSLTATEALSMGLISRVLDPESFEDEATTLLAALSNSSASALALIKRQLYELDGRGFEDGIKLGADVNALSRSTTDFKEAVARFLEK